MLLAISEIHPGLHPSEAIAIVDGAEGREAFPVDRRSLVGGRVEIGHPVGRDGGNVVVELPNETTRGAWRISVSADLLSSGSVGVS